MRWFVPFFRRNGDLSAYHHLEQRFGGWARTYAVVCYLLTQIARLGTILFLLALALVPLTGWDIRAIIIGAGLVVMAASAARGHGGGDLDGSGAGGRARGRCAGVRRNAAVRDAGGAGAGVRESRRPTTSSASAASAAVSRRRRSGSCSSTGW